VGELINYDKLRLSNREIDSKTGRIILPDETVSPPVARSASGKILGSPPPRPKAALVSGAVMGSGAAPRARLVHAPPPPAAVIPPAATPRTEEEESLPAPFRPAPVMRATFPPAAPAPPPSAFPLVSVSAGILVAVIIGGLAWALADLRDRQRSLSEELGELQERMSSARLQQAESGTQLTTRLEVVIRDIESLRQSINRLQADLGTARARTEEVAANLEKSIIEVVEVPAAPATSSIPGPLDSGLPAP
jgi:hypothetical protein